MNLRNSRLWLLPILLALIVSPTSVEPQCNIASTMNQTPSPSLMVVDKILTTSAVCTLMSYNASFCSPSPMGTVMTLIASAFTATATPFCNWTCDCGPVTIDGSDGLPVELMDFEIVEEQASGSGS